MDGVGARVLLRQLPYDISHSTDLDRVRVSLPFEELDQALSGLSEKQRAVIFLRYYAGLSYAEIAQVLEVPIGTVQSRLNAALQVLRQNMNSAEGALEPKALRKKGVTG